METEKRGPGRPPTIKKGKKTWKPAALLEVDQPKVDGFRLRWVHDEQGNLQKKRAEGWIPINKVTGLNVEHLEPGHINDGSKLSSVEKYRDLVLMALPEEDGEARDEYIRKKGRLQLRGIKDRLRDQARSAGGQAGAETVYGKVKVGNTIIE